MNYLADLDSVAFEGILAKARDNQQTRVIETQMLDGTFNIQTIGSAATRVAVEFYCSLAVRRVLEACASSATPLKCYATGTVWTGLISGGEIKADYFSPDLWKLAFDLLVLEADPR